MELLIATVFVLIMAYLAFVILFPKAVPDQGSELTNRSLDQLYKDRVGFDSGAIPADITSASLEEEVGIVKQFYQLPLLRDLYILAIKSGLRERLQQFIFIYFALAVLVALGFGEINLPLFSIVVAPIAPYFILKKYFKRKIRRRNNAFIEAFPDVLDMFVRSIRSGFPVASSFRMVAENMDPPVSNEFQRIVNELAIGQTLHACLTRLCARIDEPDIRFFMIVMKVQQETGGNLAEILTNLSYVIRKRRQLRLKIKALTSEGRATGYILGALPIVVFGVIYLSSPDYLVVLWTTKTGMICLGAAIGLIVGCMALINKMTAVDL